MSLKKFLMKYGSSDQRILFYVLCLSVSCFLQVLGFLLPGWGLLKGDLLTIHVGLWYRVTCKKGDGCQTESMVIGQANQDNDMLEYQIETFISLAACAIAITSLVRYVKKKIITIIVIGMLASLLSGVLALLASGKMGYKYQQRHNEQINAYGRSVYKSPYSLYLTGSGGMIACLITFVLVLEIHIFIKKFYASGKQYIPSEQAMVAMATTDASYSTSRPNDEISSSNSTSNTVASVATTNNSSTSQEYKSNRNENTYMYAWPSTEGRRGSKPVPESSAVADSTIYTDDVTADPEYKNVVLANGQHFVMNNIYNI